MADGMLKYYQRNLERPRFLRSLQVFKSASLQVCSLCLPDTDLKTAFLHTAYMQASPKMEWKLAILLTLPIISVITSPI